MYHSGVGGVSVGAGGVLAATGFVFSGYLWAGLVLLIVGAVLGALTFAREMALRKRQAGRT